MFVSNSLSEKPTNKTTIPTKLKVLTALLVIVVIPIIFWSGWDVVHQTRNSALILFTLLAVTTVPFYLSLPAVGTVVFMGDIYIMALAMMHGICTCVVAALCYAMFISLALANRVRPHMLIFNFSGMVCGAFIYSAVFRLAKPTDAIGTTALLLPAAVMALTSFSFSSLLVATATSWTSSKASWQFWTRIRLRLSAHYLIAAAGATFVAVAWHDHTLLVVLAVAPLVGLSWGWTKWTKMYLTRPSARTQGSSTPSGGNQENPAFKSGTG